MAKRQRLNYNSEALTQNLKQSTGQGVDAFFPDRSPTPPTQKTTQKRAASQKRTVQPNDRTAQPHGLPERANRSKHPHDTAARLNRTAAQPASRERSARSAQPPATTAVRSVSPTPEAVDIVVEMEQGVEITARPTERYSFEIFSDQKEKILEIKYRYEKRTGKRLSKSRIIREALDHYCKQVLADG